MSVEVRSSRGGWGSTSPAMALCASPPSWAADLLTLHHQPTRRVPSCRLDLLRLQFLIACAAPSEEGPSLLDRGLRGYDYVILVSRTIASGLAEIQLYVMARRGLGLPGSS